MERETINFLPLKTYSDSLGGYTFVKSVCDDFVRVIKLPSHLSKYKLGHLIRPNYVLRAELIKTKKNWILKSIHNYHEWIKADCFGDHLKISNLVKSLDSNLKEGQQTYLLENLKHPKIAEEILANTSFEEIANQIV